MSNNDDNVINDSILKSYDGDAEGVSRYTVVNGKEVFTRDRLERHEESAQADAARRGSDLYQVTTTSGRVINPSAGVDSSMLIRLPDGQGGSIQTTIGNAVQQGLIQRLNDGSYRFDEEQAIQDVTPRQEQRQEPTGEAFSDTAAEGLLRVVANDVDPSDHVAVFRELSENGNVSPGLIGRIASQLQVTPAEASQYVTRILGAFTQQAHSTINSATGGHIDATEVLAWAQTHAPKELSEAFEAQYKQRSTKAYKEITKKYVMGLDRIDPSGVMQIATDAGLQPRYEKSDGVVILTMPNGQSMTWSQALQMGLINLTGKR